MNDSERTITAYDLLDSPRFFLQSVSLDQWNALEISEERPIPESLPGVLEIGG